ncbi:MAG: hypothetical protein ACTHVE_09075 [Senegalia sp. (in: firmicutes)]|uniref:hypothetical protein n=1 Tax=Senegalia sp. (in: firmicutes) TaxID=1924098 RepID=UPI003F9CB18D
MLFNLVLIPIEMLFIYMIIKIQKEITKMHYTSVKAEKYLDNIYKLDKVYIENYNKKYNLPPLYINLLVLIVMSISTIIFEREIYHKFIMGGFGVYFIVLTIFTGLGMLNMYKKLNE